MLAFPVTRQSPSQNPRSRSIVDDVSGVQPRSTQPFVSYSEIDSRPEMTKTGPLKLLGSPSSEPSVSISPTVACWPPANAYSSMAGSKFLGPGGAGGAPGGGPGARGPGAGGDR